ncbi:hypothetical protein WJX74_010345 [Apatococcus lobatus]|uniref:Transmembrane 9 superfamily member n=1 Tax=Apatococcus lobatus TaxID=904363 RepID=A0AAW1R3Q2_9CHLO
MKFRHSSGCLLALLCTRCSAYYLPGTYPQEFQWRDHMQAEVNSLTSAETELPFNYYTLPFCKPPEGVRKSLSTINPGTILTGAQIQNSPYNFSMLVEESAKAVCKGEGQENAYGPLTDDEVNNLKDKIHSHYRVRLILDNLPVTTNDLDEESAELMRPGFDIGSEDSGNFYVNNHLMFKILVHKTNGQYTRAQKQMNIAEIEAAAEAEGGSRRHLLAGLVKESSPAPASTKKPVGVTSQTVANSAALQDDPDIQNPGDSMFMVVGFEALACSIKRDPKRPIDKKLSCFPEGNPNGVIPDKQMVEKGGSIVYTYDVYWEISKVSWASRWDAYLNMPGGRVHWFSILNSLMVVLVMSSIVAMIMMRTIRRDLARYEGLLGDPNTNADNEESGWKMVSGDVFRAPTNSLALCVQTGSGVQIITSGFITLFFAALGFLSPASRGALLTAMLVMYLLLAVAAGASSVWLYGLINRSYEGWHGVAWRVAAYFPGITLLVLSALNILIWHTGSSGAIPLGAFFSLISLWFLISIPLCFSGGMLATKQELPPFPTRTNQIPRHIPPPHWASHPTVLFFAAGLLPFGTIFVELYFAMTSMWQGYFYYIFGFCFIVGLLTVIITIEVSVVCTYVQLCAEDYLWWWRSFYRGSSVSLYVGLYALWFLLSTLHALSGLLSMILYLSYMALLLWAIWLAMGAVGFLSSFYFTCQIFGSVKAD